MEYKVQTDSAAKCSENFEAFGAASRAVKEMHKSRVKMLDEVMEALSNAPSECLRFNEPKHLFFDAEFPFKSPVSINVQIGEITFCGSYGRDRNTIYGPGGLRIILTEEESESVTQAAQRRLIPCAEAERQRLGKRFMELNKSDPKTFPWICDGLNSRYFFIGDTRVACREITTHELKDHGSYSWQTWQAYLECSGPFGIPSQFRVSESKSEEWMKSIGAELSA